VAADLADGDPGRVAACQMDDIPVVEDEEMPNWRRQPLCAFDGVKVPRNRRAGGKEGG